MAKFIKETEKNLYKSEFTIPRKSTFLRDGKLTPDEFVEAGLLLLFLEFVRISSFYFLNSKEIV